MYKVFINDKPVFFTTDKEGFNLNKHCLQLPFKNKKNLRQQIKDFEKNKSYKKLILFHDPLQELWETFVSLYSIIETAGGLVKNSKGDVLFIFRNEKWDLPKGKIEKKESIEDAAKREIGEECGVKGLSIIKNLAPTYHTYKLNNKNILKKSYWLEMYCKNDKVILQPQLEEGITIVKWVQSSEIKMVLKNTYGTIKDVLKQF